MARQHGKRDILYDGSAALKELTENYATMDVKAFCAKWGLSIATVRSTASRKGIQRPVLPKPEPETPPVPAYEPPKDMIPPSLLKQVRGRRLRAWKEPSSRAELNTMPVPYPFSEIADAPYNRGLDETPEETGRVIRHTKNR